MNSVLRFEDLELVRISRHRNGISGIPFWAIIFVDTTEKRTMIASLFDEQGFCAVYDIVELAVLNIEFANGNSWRGDFYEPHLRRFVKEHCPGS